ncbi:MAG: hypothetical protein U9R37_04400, partial [Campylobacterota bacterium]|nr:hypothetical protein [Campylobacterota bacterium]
MEKIKLISKLNHDIESMDIDKFAKDILNNSNFEYDEYENKSLRDYIVTIKQDKSEWNDEYFKDHLALLDNNFSKERLEHILELRDYLYINKTNSKKKIFLLSMIGIIIVISIVYLLLNKQNVQIQKTEPVVS